MPGLIEDTEIETSQSTKKIVCPNYHVIFINDDYHSFQFVILVIMELFHRTAEEAFRLTVNIHKQGQAIIITCPKERAQLYLEQVSSIKEGEKGAISCVIEPAE